MRCAVCNSDETYIKKHNHEYNIKGNTIKFSSDRKFCRECNNLVYDSLLDNEASKIAIKLYNEKFGIDSKRIVELREKLKLSQELFSRIIGCAKKTLISYEKGTSIPNDNYLIMLNSILAKPETICILVESNKEKFTKKELEKIENKACNLFVDDLFKKKDSNLTEYNGYTPFNKEKLKNIVLFLSNEGVLKTKLLKELFYIDFYSYRETGASITGLEYVKLPFGPVPDNYENLINEFTEENIIEYTVELKNDLEFHNIIKKDDYKLDIFLEEEIKIIKKVKEYFENYNSSKIVEFSHKEEAFLKTDYYKKISYDYSFDMKQLN